jgi:hypothetical protein
METKLVDLVEIQKDLYKSKAVAKLMYYEPSNGDLMYTVNALGKDWVFPIHTIQKTTIKKRLLSREDDVFVEVEANTIKLTDDLKGARWEPEIKGSSLMRWIKQAINAGEFH